MTRHFEALPDLAGADGIPELPTLVDALARVPDPRGRRGTRYEFGFLLAASVVAVVCGARSLLGLARWIRGADRAVLERLGLGRQAVWRAPVDSTLGRAWRGIDADALDDALGSWVAQVLTTDPGGAGDTPAAVAFDGKVMRGAARAGTKQPHLVAVVDQASGTVLGQRAVDAKSNEITAFTATLDGVDLTGAIVTADALHTQRGHAGYLRERGAYYLFPVKENQPAVFAALDRLPWEKTLLAYQSIERNRGRTELRELKVLPAPDDLPFPDAAQVLLIERTTTGRTAGKTQCFAELAVTSAPWHRAAPARLAEIVRGQWQVEAVHLIRDTTYREDASRTHIGQTPRVMASLRNTAISIIRLMGWTSITEANDHYRDHPQHALQALGFTTPEVTERHQSQLIS